MTKMTIKILCFWSFFLIYLPGFAAGKLVDGNLVVTGGATLGSPLPVTSGGTGVTTSTGTGNTVLSGSPTIVTPTIVNFVNANHTHLGASGGGVLDASAIQAGTLLVGRGGTGTTTSTGTGSVVLSASPSITGTVGGTATYTNPTLTAPTIATFANATHNHQSPTGGGTLDAAAITTSVTGSGNVVKDTSPTIVTPTIASFANSNHSHQNSAGGGALDAAAISTGTIPVARGGTGVTTSTGSGNNVLSSSPTIAAGVFTGNSNFDSNTLFIDSTNHRVGLGLSDPQNKIALPDAAYIGWKATGSTGSETVKIRSNNNALEFVANSVLQMQLSSNGFLTLYNNGMNVGGSIFSQGISPNLDNTYQFGSGGSRWTALYAVNGTIQTSDRTEKKEISNSDLGLDFITKLRPVSYHWKKKDNGKHYGLVAQEVKKSLAGRPFYGLIEPKNKDERYALAYDEFIAPLIAAVQELNHKVTSLESQCSLPKKD